MSSSDNLNGTLQRLNELFGSYKAEWLQESIYDHFTEPTYFPELATSHPCFLLGGRGTGKTTTLLSLSYLGQYAFHRHQASTVSSWPYYGIFYRVNTNRVAAFKGPELSEDKWIKLFSHYLNLLICYELAKFANWFAETSPGLPGLTPKSLKLIAQSLRVTPAETVADLLINIRSACVELEASVNTIADQPVQSLSLQGAPIDIFFEQLRNIECFSKKNFFILIDEYENFEDYQQRVVNTLIKHSAPLYTFKVGVRELGFRCRTTLNQSEQLIHPADYVRVNIAEKLTSEKFEAFAKSVCQERLERLSVPVLALESLLPSINPDDEAEMLGGGADGALSRAVESLAAAIPVSQTPHLSTLSRLMQYFIVRRAETAGVPLGNAWNEFTANREKWLSDFNNHRYALLFTFGRLGARNPKLDCGWKTLTRLAHSNIRYLLELVDQGIKHHLLKDGQLTEPIPYITQTEAAAAVGRKYLTELEGLAVDGARLTKLLLGLGRVFQVLAAEHYRDNPEVTQFCLPPDNSAFGDDGSVESLLRSAVNHLALVRFHGTKLADESETKEYDYMMHPIYSPFFVTSFRKKRKMTISASQLIGLINKPKTAISEILKHNPDTPLNPVPVQLELFRSYYESDHR